MVIATPERCHQLIALFDEIIVNRFDYQILKLQDYELAEARRLRRRAEAECRQGQYWFGVHAIEDALEKIGLVPPPENDAAPAD
jgi:hypothetical protein